MRRAVVWTNDALNELLAISRTIGDRQPDRRQSRCRQDAYRRANLGDMATGRSGRVIGTYEKLVPGLPTILACEIASRPEGELIALLPAIRGAREWPVGE